MQVELKTNPPDVNTQQLERGEDCLRQRSLQSVLVGSQTFYFYFCCAVKLRSHPFSVKASLRVSEERARHHSFSNDSAGPAREPTTLGPAAPFGSRAR